MCYLLFYCNPWTRLLSAAAMGATFAFTDSYVANLRQTDDPLNGAAGGCAAGLLAGVRGAYLLWLSFSGVMFKLLL